MITFKAGQLKIDVATPYLQKMKEPGVALIGKAQEVQWVTMGTDVRRDPDTGCPHYSFKKVDRRITVYYFYAMDEEWGPTFLKMAAYFPYPGKLRWTTPRSWPGSATASPVLRCRTSSNAPCPEFPCRWGRRTSTPASPGRPR